jgi:type II secretory pathway pseudopilin PulG
MRIHARLHDERGFSLLETLVAITVIFGSVIALAYTATIGFGYQSLSRQRQAANGIANEVMEQIRGLAYENVQAGLLSTDLTGDPNIVSCSGVNRFLSCTANASIPGSGDPLVTSPGLSTTVPLVPHRSSTAPNTNPTRDGITYGWSSYVTRANTTDAPYRVTVIVTWAGGAVNAPNKFVRLQSIFWSPAGCRSTETHPFAAPCQPFFFGTLSAPQANVTVAGSVDQLTFTDGELIGGSVSSAAQQEQVSQAQGSWQSTEVAITDGAGTRTVGGTSGTTSADSDGSTATAVYSRTRCPDEVTCTSGSVSSSSAGNTITFTAGSGTVAESDSTTSAGAGNICPAPPATAESDSAVCSGSRILQGNTLSTTLNLQHGSSNPGAITVVRVGTPSAATTASVHRNSFANTTGCTPSAGEDGCLALTASRTLGTINVGALPANMTPPTGWSGASAWNGYFLSLVGYQDSLSGSVGTDSPLPSATQSGTIYYYNGSGYTAVPVANVALDGLSVSYAHTQVVSGATFVTTIATEPTGMLAGRTSLVPSAPSGNVNRTDLDAQAIAPGVSVRYTVTESGVTIVDLVVTLNAGPLEARGTYAPAPAEDS